VAGFQNTWRRCRAALPSWTVWRGVFGLFALAAEKTFENLLGECFVDDAAPFGEQALDRFRRRIVEQDPIGTDPQPAVVLERTFEGLRVALFGGEVSQRLTEATMGPVAWRRTKSTT